MVGRQTCTDTAAAGERDATVTLAEYLLWLGKESESELWKSKTVSVNPLEGTGSCTEGSRIPKPLQL
jgi:hypothetical protein